MLLIWNLLQINLTDLSLLWNRNLHLSFSCFSNEIFVNLILLMSVFVKFDYIQRLTATVWRKLCVFSKDFSFLKSTFQFNELLSAFVSNMFELFTLLITFHILLVLLSYLFPDTHIVFWFVLLSLYLHMCMIIHQRSTTNIINYYFSTHCISKINCSANTCACMKMLFIK